MMADEAELERLAREVRALDDRGSRDEAIVAWLKDRTATFGESARVLALARDLSTADAHAILHASETWRAVATQFHILKAGAREAAGVYISVNGRTFGLSEVLKLPGGSFRVLALESDDDPAFSGRLVVEPLPQ
jgi:hypothetical protein